jgi:hypothetical protein
MDEPLKLRAADAEDLSVISACMQDALICVSDARFVPAERCFILVANRFRWENCPEFLKDDPDRARAKAQCESYERVNCALIFNDVTGVRLANMEPAKDVNVLELLAVTAEQGDPGKGEEEGGAVVLFFSGGGTIRLEVDKILCHLQDLGEPWPTKSRPQHPVAEDN